MYEPMADIQHRAYLANCFKEKKNTINFHTLITLSSVRITNPKPALVYTRAPAKKTLDEMHRKKLTVASTNLT